MVVNSEGVGMCDTYAEVPAECGWGLSVTVGFLDVIIGFFDDTGGASGGVSQTQRM